jgi:hypothetical protein
MFKPALDVYFENQKKIRQYTVEYEQLKQVADLSLCFGKNKDATVGGADRHGVPERRASCHVCSECIVCSEIS